MASRTHGCWLALGIALTALAGCSAPAPASTSTAPHDEPVADEREPDEPVADDAARACATDEECVIATPCCGCPRVPAAMHVREAEAERERCRRVRCAACALEPPPTPPQVARCVDARCVERPAEAGAGRGVPESCDAIAAEYERLVSADASRGCATDEDCRVIAGHCGVGIGGCAYVLNQSVSPARLDALADAWSARECGGGVCRCARPPSAARCEAGACVGRSP